MSLLKLPYTNLHELNLDWIIEQLNQEGAVLSVNGKHGTVTLTAEDIERTPNNPQTVEQALTAQGTSIQTARNEIGVTPLPTTAQTLTGAIAEHETDISGIDNKIGTTALPTTAQTLTGAIAENAGEIADIQDNVIGSTALPTTAQTLTGAITENAGEIADIQDDIGSTALPTTAQTLTGAIAELHGRVYHKIYNFTELGFAAGSTLGTRVLQQYTDISTDIAAYGTPVAALITAIGDSGKCHFQTFMYNNLLYLNGYSASSNAMTDNSVSVRVTFLK